MSCFCFTSFVDVIVPAACSLVTIQTVPIHRSRAALSTYCMTVLNNVYCSSLSWNQQQESPWSHRRRFVADLQISKSLQITVNADHRSLGLSQFILEANRQPEPIGEKISACRNFGRFWRMSRFDKICWCSSVFVDVYPIPSGWKS